MGDAGCSVSQPSLECKVETGHHDHHRSHEDQNADLVGRDEPTPAVEPVVAGESLVIPRRH